MERRHFLKNLAAGSVAVGTGLLSTTTPAAEDAQPRLRPRRPVRLGGPVFASQEDPEKYALLVKMARYRAAYCPKVSLADTKRVHAFRDAFRQNDLVIAEVGRWCNLLDADPKKRAANLQRVTDGLALADEIGALCCVDTAGSFNKTDWAGPHPKNLSEDFFDAIVENARKIIDAVKPKKAKFAYEMMPWAYPDSVESSLRLVKAVDRPAYGIHLDPCNLINSPKRFYNNTALLNDCFKQLSEWIVSCHAKDIQWVRGGTVQLVEVMPGTGGLDYATYLRQIAACKNDIPLMVEHLKGKEQYEQAQQNIFKMGREAGVVFDYL